MPHTNRQKRIPASRVAQTHLIRRFHAIEKELAQLGHSAGDDEKRKRLTSERDSLGGLSAYQNASVHGGDTQRGGESSKWLVRQLLDLPNDLIEWKGKPGSERRSTYVRMLPTKIRLLDVGAIAGTAYLKWPWIDSTSIDLNAQHPRVIKSDFFSFPKPEDDNQAYHVVCLSLVINFVGSLTDRARILVHAHSYFTSSLRGLLYIVLPLACVSNSRFLTADTFDSILASTGWSVVRRHESTKLYYLVCVQDLDRCDGRAWPKDKARQGVDRNNFAVVLDQTDADDALRLARDQDHYSDENDDDWRGMSPDD